MRTIVLTGATGGLGRAAAYQLAPAGDRFVLIGRDEDKLRSTAQDLRRRGAGVVDTLRADFRDLSSVETAAARALAQLERVDVLVSNAGAVFARRTLTVDGHEATWAVNHLAPFLITERLRPLLVATPGARVVITASTGHYRASLDLDDLAWERGYTTFRAYCRSKLANVMYARHLASSLAAHDVSVNALHPGTVASNIWNGAPKLARPALSLLKRVAMSSPEQGGAWITDLAIDRRWAGITGAYVEQGQIREPSALAQDERLAARLAQVSATAVGYP